MDQPLTIVLPMHNGERSLRSKVLELLELAHETKSMLEFVIVDDASTDETFETACELARVYPQIKVLHQPVRQGLAAALAMVRNQLAPELIIVHDGRTAIDVHELRLLLQERARRSPAETRMQAQREEDVDAVGSRRLGWLRALQKNMETAHGSVSSFSWVCLDKPSVSRRAAKRNPLAPAVTPTMMPGRTSIPAAVPPAINLS